MVIHTVFSVSWCDRLVEPEFATVLSQAVAADVWDCSRIRFKICELGSEVHVLQYEWGCRIVVPYLYECILGINLCGRYGWWEDKKRTRTDDRKQETIVCLGF